MSERPNILWIVATQWRAQACGYAGDPNARTPCLDRLAAASIDFTQAVTPHPFGPFARGALLTGTPSPENGVRAYYDPLPDGARTVAHSVAAHGYETAFFGKWHLGRREVGAALVGATHARTLVPPDARGGFDFWEGFEGGFLLNDPWLHGTRLPTPTLFPGYQSNVLAERAGEWVHAREGRPQPWFAVVSLESPHPPYDAPAPAAAPDPDRLTLGSSVPRGDAREGRARRELSGYYAHIQATDQAIGALLDTVRSPAAAPAIVVFTSVHGDMHGAHGLFRKGWPYEESIRVPLLVSLPSALGGRTAVRTAQLASLLDLPRWTAAWAGGQIRGPLMTPSEEGQKISMPSVVALPDQCDRIWHGIRTRERKLILEADGTPWLLFDLAADPSEERNLVAEPRFAAESERLRRACAPVAERKSPQTSATGAGPG